MSFAVYYFGAIRVASGDAAVAALSQRAQGALVSGEASGFVVNGLNGLVPTMGAWNDVNFFADVSKA
jgi:heme A synthase